MFKIYDGREWFYQWDKDRKLIVEDSSVKEVHFCNRTGECSLVCETYTEDGLTLVNVPNILLTDDWRINVYAYDGNYTKFEKDYSVKPRTKPDDYVYTETEIKSYDALEARIAALEEGGGGESESGYYVPSVIDGVLYWEPSNEELPAIEPTTIGARINFETLIPPQLANYDAEKIVKVSRDFIDGNLYAVLIQMRLISSANEYSYPTIFINGSTRAVKYSFSYNGTNYWFQCSYDGNITYGEDSVVVLTNENYQNYIGSADEVSY